MNVQKLLSEMNDGTLKSEFKDCIDALKQAAEECPNSEWHQSCFAAIVMFSNEMNKRKLTIATVH